MELTRFGDFLVLHCPVLASTSQRTQYSAVGNKTSLVRKTMMSVCVGPTVCSRHRGCALT